jgi:superfamily II DNA or RNA helicase
MKYEEFIEILKELGEYIQTFKDEHMIDPDIIIKFIKSVFKNISVDIKKHCITHFNYVIKTANYIKKIVEMKTNQVLLNNIIVILREKKISITDNINIVYNDVLEFMINNDIINDIYSTNFEPFEKIENDPNPIYFDKFVPRINQLDAYKYLEENGLTTCIHCQATGCGKTCIILRYIDYAYNKYKNNAKIILFTERVNILKDLFEFSTKDGKANKKKICNWKEVGIADLTNFNIINCVNRKDPDWVRYINDEDSTASTATLIVINRAYLTLNKKNYEKFGNIKLILHDECHNTSSKNCNEFLKYCKNIPIVGFSATPLRTGKYDKEKLLDIYGKDGKLNLATNYNMIFAISQNLILPPEFYWYQISTDHLNKCKTDENKLNYEYDTVSTILDSIIGKLPSKKIIAWCGRMDKAKAWKNKFIENHKNKPNLFDFKFYLDTSKTTDEEYEEFKSSDGYCILFCANKHREGSDIRRLDSCIFLDGVVNRGSIPFIQSIGRVLRIDTSNPEKKNGIVIDGIYKTTEDYNYERDFVDKIIGYYMALQNISDENLASQNYEKYIKLKEIIKFDKDKKNIYLDFNGNKININMNILHWDNIVNKFDSILQNKIKISPNENMMDKGQILVNIFGFNIRTDFYNEYNNISIEDKQKYNLPDIDTEDYQKLFNGKSWFEFLDLDHDYYNSPFEARNNLITKVILENPKDKWDDWCKLDNRLPPYPEYVWNIFNYNIFNSNINNKKYN